MSTFTLIPVIILTTPLVHVNHSQSLDTAEIPLDCASAFSLPRFEESWEYKTFLHKFNLIGIRFSRDKLESGLSYKTVIFI